MKNLKLVLAVAMPIFATAAQAFTLAWNPNPIEQSVQGYVIHQKVGTNFVAFATNSPSVTEYPLKFSVPGTYEFAVSAFNAWGSSTLSDSVTVLVPSANPPAGFTMQNGVLSWTSNPPSEEITGYKLYVKAADGRFNLVAQTTNVFVKVPLAPAQYELRVSATNSWSESTVSDPIFTPVAPSKVGGLTR